MTAEQHLADLDRALRWRPRAEQMRRLDAELALWLPRLREDESGLAAAIVPGLVSRRRLVQAGQQQARKSRAMRERRRSAGAVRQGL